MKKFVIAGLVGLFALLINIGTARADAYTYTITVTNGQPITYSDPLPVSGYLDKIEVTQDASATSTVTVATYNGTTAVDTLFSLAVAGETTSGHIVARPRFIGTTTAGVNIAAVTGTAVGTNTTTMLVAGYEKAMLGGNLKVAVTASWNDGSNPVTVKIYYEPVKK